MRDEGGLLGAGTPAVTASTARFPRGSGKRIVHALAVVFGAELVLILGFFVLAPVLHLGDDPFSGTLPSFLGLGACAALVLGGVAGGMLFGIGRVPRHEIGAVVEKPAQNLALGVLGFVLVFLTIAGTYLVQGATLGDLLQNVAAFTVQQRLLFIMIGLFTPLAEELIFRGYLQSALAERHNLPMAIVLTAVIFSIYHLNFRPTALIVKTIQGLIYGCLRGRNRSLLAPYTAHALVWFVLGSL